VCSKPPIHKRVAHSLVISNPVHKPTADQFVSDTFSVSKVLRISKPKRESRISLIVSSVCCAESVHRREFSFLWGQAVR
jgi:hypothetical protein